jgi:hypothetical protein
MKILATIRTKIPNLNFIDGKLTKKGPYRPLQVDVNPLKTMRLQDAF